MKLPPVVLLGSVLALGFYLPPELDAVLREIGDLLAEKGAGS